MLCERSRFLLQGLKCRRTFVTVSTAAEKVFSDTSSAAFLAAAGNLKSVPQLHVTGRANVGKSTLFNAVLGRKTLLHTSSKAGRTRELNFYRVGKDPGKLVLVDAPGYGARGKREWGELFDGYLETRKQLKRVYILFNAKHGLNETDTSMLQHLSRYLISKEGTQPFTLQSVITKVDLVPSNQVAAAIGQIKKDIFAAAPLCLPPILTSCEMDPPFGIENIRKNIAEACELA
ncbi:hypothetical protein H1R20_g15863, partial [Candolleomyces eurysporus]